jgi:tRNA(Ile2)-agmatinylcytidine synthase
VTAIGLDDTDSRERGMCTTYVAARIARRVRDRGAAVERLLLVRLNPAIEHKTRGNAALAIHTDLTPDDAFALAREELDASAVTADPDTNPGLVVAPGNDGSRGGEREANGLDGAAVPEPVAEFARAAVRDRLAVDDARRLIDSHGFRSAGWKTERGLVGALAAVGAPAALWEWTFERVAYREPERWGTPRAVERESVFAAAAAEYPAAWDTIDREEGEAVCVPHTPGPVLFGIRGDEPAACRRVADRIESEAVAFAETFTTNQGTDAHLRAGSIGALRDGRSYRVDGTVTTPPATRRGGHVFIAIADGSQIETGTADEKDGEADVDVELADGERDGGGERELQCVAFEPTKRFRDRVRALQAGDRLTVCGEFADRRADGVGGSGEVDSSCGVDGSAGARTLKLEKFAVRSLQDTERVTPTCPECERSMESAGRGQGYRCRDCGTGADGKVEQRIERALEPGWYEVPPCARRHVATPLVRGGFDAPIHPER